MANQDQLALLQEGVEPWNWPSVRVPPMKRKVVSQKYRFLRWTRYFGISGGDFQSNSAFERQGGCHTFRLYRFSARS